MYQTKQVPRFALLYKTFNKTKQIYRYKKNILQDGIYREIFSNGASCYGTRILAKSPKTGEENREYRLFKYADGDIEYEENIHVIGQDNEWRELTKYKFNLNNLAWEKVKL